MPLTRIGSFTYPTMLSPAASFAAGETGFVIAFPDIPEAITQGEREADALEQVADALEEAIAARIECGAEIAPPGPHTGHGCRCPRKPR